MATNRKATEGELSELHSQLARTLRDILKSGEANSAMLNVARQFLKDNGIECDGMENPEIKNIVDEIPAYVGVDTFNDDDE